MNERNENLGDFLVKAMGYLNNGKYNESIIYWEKALALDSDNVTAWVMMGQSYENLENWSKAIDCYEEALVLEPQNQDAKWFKEQVLEKSDSPKRAKKDKRLPSKGVLPPFLDNALESFLNEKVKEVAKSVEGKKLMQKAKKELENMPEDMKKTFNFILDIPDPSERADLIKLYRESVIAQRTQDTLFVYERLAHHLTDNKWVWNMFINATIQFKMDPRKGLDMVRTALQQNPKDHFKWGLLGLMHLALGKFKNALEYFNKQVDLEPSNLKPYYRISQVFKLDKNMPKAIEYLEKYANAFPNDIVVQKELQILRNYRL